jgi:hypothetical protein
VEPCFTPAELEQLREALYAELRRHAHAMTRVPAVATAGRTRRLVDAVRRMEDGVYGYCLRCRRAIPFARLAAMPDVPTCIDCSWAQEFPHHQPPRGDVAP